MAVFAALAVMAFLNAAHADYATTPQPYPAYPQPAPNPAYPYYGPYPYPAPGPAPYPAPVYGQPYVTCFAQGLANGALFYGVGLNVYSANQWALYACQSTGQYCQLTGCR